MKVLLMTPPYHCGMIESAGVWLPLGLVYLAGEVRKIKDVEVIIYDAMSLYHNYEDISKVIEREKPDILGISAITASINDSLKVCALAKRIYPPIKTVLGNVHPTFMYNEVLNSDIVDFVVIGEGEITFKELVLCLKERGDPAKVKGIAFKRESQIILTPARELIQDLDNLTPAWDLLPWDIYTYFPKENSRLAIVSSSRGCLSSCSFCSQRLFWKGTWRGRSPKNFVDELEKLAKYYQVNVVMLSDELPNADKLRWQKILDLLIERNLGIELLIETRADHIVRDEDILEKYKRAGISHIYVGVESVDPQVLVKYNKGINPNISKKAIDLINDYDIVSETSFVVGLPEENEENLGKTLELAKIYNPDMCFFIPLTPWPYTSMFETYKEYIQHTDWSKYNLVDPVILPKNWLNLESFKKALMHYTTEFFLYKFSQISQLSSFKKEFMLNLIKLLAKNSYLKDLFLKTFFQRRFSKKDFSFLRQIFM